MKQRFNINKRVLAAIAVVAVAVIGLGVIMYVIVNDRKAVDNPGAYYGQDADGFSYAIDEKGDLGTAGVVSVEQVQKAFGDPAEVAKPEKSGVLRLGTTYGETATYEVKLADGAVRFEVDTRTYESKDDVEKANVFAGAEEPDVDGVGEEAHYLVPYAQELLSEQQTALIVLDGLTSYKFAIIQQTEGMILDEQAAKDILLTVAKDANYDNVKK